MATRANIHEFKAHLARFTREVKAGGTVILCERNVPIAELRPIRKPQSERRPEPGLFRDEIEIGEDFFAADEEIAASFFGGE